MDAGIQHPVELTHPSKEKHGSADLPQLNMKDAIREVLKNHLLDDASVTLYGEDIEDPKVTYSGYQRAKYTIPRGVLWVRH